MTELEELKATNLFLSNELRRANIDRLEVQDKLEQISKSVDRLIKENGMLIAEKYELKEETLKKGHVISELKEELEYHTNDNDLPRKMEVSE